MAVGQSGHVTAGSALGLDLLLDPGKRQRDALAQRNGRRPAEHLGEVYLLVKGALQNKQ